MAKPETLADRVAAVDAARARLAQLAARQRQPAGQSIPARDPRATIVASPGQRRMWLLSRLNRHSTVYHVSASLRIFGELNREALRQALADLVARHEPLRTSFELAEGSLRQRIHEPYQPPLDTTNLATLPEPVGERIAMEVLRHKADLPLHLDSGRVVRAAIVRVAHTQTLLGLSFHHAAVDAIAIGVLLEELGEFYRARCTSTGARLAPLPVQFADYALWQQKELVSPRLLQLRAYWSAKLAGLPEIARPPVTRAACDDHAVAGPAGYEEFAVPPALAQAVRELAREHRASLFMALLAGYVVALAESRAGTDLPVGTTVSGRTAPGTEHMVGFFAETLVLRTALAPSDSFADLLGRVRDTCLEAYEHQDLPFDLLIEELRPRRRAGINPVFQVYFSLRPAPLREKFAQFAAERAVFEGSAEAKFDVAMYVLDSGAELRCWIDYRADRYEPEAMARLAHTFTATLRAATQHPHRSLAGLLSSPLAISTFTACPPATTLAALADGAAEGAGAVTSATSVPLDVTAVAAIATADGTTDGAATGGPRDRWEHYVVKTWSDVLGVPQVGLDDDFFALGGQSMAAMLMAQRLQQLTGRTVPLTLLFASPTAGQLAAALRHQRAGRPESCLVELNTAATGRPVFFLHGAAGELYMYLDLISQMRLERPCLGVHHGLSEEMPQLAARYADQITAREPHGPYDLVGFSAAGMFALAVAAELTARGLPVGRLVLIDTHPALYEPDEVDEAFVLSWYLPYAPPAVQLRQTPGAQRLRQLIEMGVAAGELAPDTAVEELADLQQTLLRHGRALASYRPGGHSGPVNLLVRNRSRHRLEAAWSRYDERIDVVALAVENHLDLMRGDTVKVTAACLRRLLSGGHTP